MPEKQYIDRAWKIYATLKEIDLIGPSICAMQIVLAIAWTLQNYHTIPEIPVVEERVCGDY
jgi:hypothetical protein